MPSRVRRFGALIVLATIATALTSLALAMQRYPGGTEIDRHCIGHSFWFNFLCDLTNERALNGASNAAGRGFARTAMTALAVGFGAFWLILPAEFPAHRAIGRIVRVAGAISVLGFLAIPVATTGILHAVAVFAAAVPGVLAATVGAIATVRYVDDKLLLLSAFGSIATATIDSVLYAQRVMGGFRSCSPALPVFQRLIMLFVLAWGAMTALRALRAVREPAVP